MAKFNSFKDGFDALQRNATSLRTQTEPNIDELLPLVQESIEAYNVCKERINAVELALKEALSETAVGDRTRNDIDDPSGPSPQSHG